MTLIPQPKDDLCLDFVNTRSWRGREQPSERLPDFSSLLAWLRKSAGIDRASIRTAELWAVARPTEAEKLHSEALNLREALFGCLGAASAAVPPAPADWRVLQRALSGSPPRQGLAVSKGAFCWQVPPLRPAAPELLVSVLWSAADLLSREARLRVRRCANSECQWLFLDESRTGTRRWCDMASCGNRAKARRHYLKSKVA